MKKLTITMTITMTITITKTKNDDVDGNDDDDGDDDDDNNIVSFIHTCNINSTKAGWDREEPQLGGDKLVGYSKA